MKENVLVWLKINKITIFVGLIVLSIFIHLSIKTSMIVSLKIQISKLNAEKIQHETLIKALKQKNDETERRLKKLKNHKIENSYVTLTKDTLINDMNTRFPTFSKKTINLIINTVLEESNKYNINPIMLYSLGIVESSHRYWIEHDTITIYVTKSNGKTEKVNTKAVGWGGVVWEWHSKMLKEKGIALERSDLFFLDVNIKATAAIYNKFYEQPLKDGVKNRDISAQRRYFGGNYNMYSDKINNEVLEVIKSEIYSETYDEPVPNINSAKLTSAITKNTKKGI